MDRMLINRGRGSKGQGRGLKGGMTFTRSASYDRDDPPDDNTKSIIIIKEGLAALKSFKELTNADDKRKLVTSLQNKLYILHVQLRFELGSKLNIIYGRKYFNSIAVYSVIIIIIYNKMNNKGYPTYIDIPEIKTIIDNLDNFDSEDIKIKNNIISNTEHIIDEYKNYDIITNKANHTDDTIIEHFYYSLACCRNIYIIKNWTTKENIDEMHKYEENIIYRDITTVYNQSCKYDISTRYDELIKYYKKINVNIEGLLIQYIIKLYILYNSKVRYDLVILCNKIKNDDSLKETYELDILAIDTKYNNLEDIHHIYEDIKTMEKDNNFIKYCMYIIGIIKTKMSTSAVISAPYKHLKYKTKYLELS